MPQHIPSKYNKFNSHLSAIDDLDEFYTRNPYDIFDRYCEEGNFMVFNRIIPFALILYSETEKKFIFQNSLIDVCPMNTSPKYILAQFIETSRYNRFGLIRLGQLGFKIGYSFLNLVSERKEIRDSLYLYHSTVLSIQKYSKSSIEFYISDNYNFTNLKIALCQENILKTEIIFKTIKFSSIPTRLWSSQSSQESIAVSPQIIRNGHKENIYLDNSISLFHYKNDTQNIESICSHEFEHRYILLVNQNNNEIFIMSFLDTLEFYKMELSPCYNTYEMKPVHFENVEEINVTNKGVTSCPLTGSKYLVFFYRYDDDDESNMKSVTYQELFTTDKGMWMLVDLNSNSVKRVYPIIYDLEKEKLPIVSSDGFQTVTKRLTRRWIHMQDGDLNGGCTDSFLIDGTKHSNGPFINHDPISPIRFSDGFLPEYSSLFAFRPFPYNSELFQVHLSFPFCKDYSDYKYTKKDLDKYGFSFRFYFKFYEEATVTLFERLLEFEREGQFSDISISSDK